jgi:hypothetical protein
LDAPQDRSGSRGEADIVEAFRIRAALLIAGGYYDRENRRESEETKRALRKRAQGKCEKCGRKFGEEGDSRFTVQHTAEGKKLAWCWRCNMDDALARMQPISDAEHRLCADELTTRIRSPKPLYFVDDPEAWTKSYRALLRIARHPERCRNYPECGCEDPEGCDGDDPGYLRPGIDYGDCEDDPAFRIFGPG